MTKETINRLESAINVLYKNKICSYKYKLDDNKSLNLNTGQLSKRINMAVENVREGLKILEKNKKIRVGIKYPNNTKIIYLSDKQHNKILNSI